MHKYIIAISILGAILSSACSEQTIYSSCTEGMVICDGNRRLECINSNGATEWQTVEECAVGCFADVGRTFCSVFDSNGIQQESYLCKDGYLHKYDIIDSKSGKKTEFVFECPNKTCKDTTNCECNPELSCLDGCQSDGSCKPKEGCEYGNNDDGSCKRADSCVAGYEDNGKCKPLDCYIGNEDDGSCIKAIGCPLDSKGNELIGLDGACLDCKSGIITDGDEKGKCERLEGCKLGWAPDGSCIQAASCLLGYQDDGTCKGCANGVGSDGQCIKSQNCKIQDRWNDDGSCINKLGCVISKMTEDGGLTFWDDKGDCLHANCIQAVEPNDNGTCPCNNAEACFDDGALIDERTMNCSFNEVIDKNSAYKDNYNPSEQCRIYEACADGQCYCELNHEFYVNGEYYCTDAANCGRCKRIDSNGNHMYDWFENKALIADYNREKPTECWWSSDWENTETRPADCKNALSPNFCNTTANRNAICTKLAETDESFEGEVFCDSFIDYHCGTKCTSDEQCMEGFICRQTDGRCSADSFTTVWSSDLREKIYKNLSNNELTLLMFQTDKGDCQLEICPDWEEGKECDFQPYNNCSNGINIRFEGIVPTPGKELIVKIKGKVNGVYITNNVSWYLPYLKEIRSFGEVGLGQASHGAFEGCTNLTKVSSVDIPDPTKLVLERMFIYANQFNHSIENWDVSSVTSMKKLFWKAFSDDFKSGKFNQPLSKWDVSNVENMADMLGCTSYNHPLNNWNISKVQDMAGLFGHSSFNQPLNNWANLFSDNVDIHYMFMEARIFNQNLSNWNLSVAPQDIKKLFTGSGLVLDYISEFSENNLCKIYKSNTWSNIKDEIDRMYSEGEISIDPKTKCQ